MWDYTLYIWIYTNLDPLYTQHYIYKYIAWLAQVYFTSRLPLIRLFNDHYFFFKSLDFLGLPPEVRCWPTCRHGHFCCEIRTISKATRQLQSRLITILRNPILTPLLQRTLKNYALWNFLKSALNLEPSQHTLKKNSKCVNIDHINALWKSNFAWITLFLLLKKFKDDY